MHARRTIFYVIFLTAIRFMSFAQTPNPVAEDSGAKMYQITKGVFAVIHDDATDEWPHGNSGVIVGDKSVLVVDATYLPSRAKADIALIRQITDKPVEFLVYTHWHFDHNNGAIAYQDAFPKIEIVSERHTKEYTELNGLYWARMSTASESYKRKSLNDMETMLASGKDKDGNTITEQQRSKLSTHIAQRKNELDELQSLKVVSPTKVFEKELSLDLGRRKVLLKDWGAANSPNDVTVYLPEEKILFTGDILVQSPLPYTLNSHPVPWISVLREIEKIDVSAIVPGHGPVMKDHAYTKKVRAFFEATVQGVKDLLSQGKTIAEIQTILTMSDHFNGVWDYGTQEARDDWKVTVNMLIERSSRNLRGQ